jgi:hypothetical protein
VQAGRLADLIVVDGDPLERPGVLRERDRIWLVLQLGAPVAGAALERDPAGLRAAAAARADRAAAVGGQTSE